MVTCLPFSAIPSGGTGSVLKDQIVGHYHIKDLFQPKGVCDNLD